MSDVQELAEKMDPEDELAEYFIQYRERDIYELTPKSTFKINITENALFTNILEEEREKFRTVIRKGLIKAYSRYKIDEERVDLISKITDVFSDVKIEIKIPENIKIDAIKAEKHEGRIITFSCETFAIAEPKTITIREFFISVSFHVPTITVY